MKCICTFHHISISLCDAIIIRNLLIVCGKIPDILKWLRAKWGKELGLDRRQQKVLYRRRGNHDPD